MKSCRVRMPAIAVALLSPLAAPAEQLDTVLVLGTRGSLESAIERKRDSDDIVDSVVAAEIHKLPDLSVADAVQRITGVQIARDRGEASIASVRGLVQVETTLNGREIFTAGFGRAFDYADLPSEMLAGIDVYKSSAAPRIEGGLGGLVDLRTRRPFDFRDRTLALSARLMHGDLAARSAGQFSVLFGERATTGVGRQPSIRLAAPRRRWPKFVLSLVELGTAVSWPGTRSSRQPEVARALQTMGVPVPLVSSRQARSCSTTFSSTPSSPIPVAARSPNSSENWPALLAARSPCISRAERASVGSRKSNGRLVRRSTRPPSPPSMRGAAELL